MDLDVVYVMSDGQIVEMCPPKELVEKAGGMFRALAVEEKQADKSIEASSG